MTHNCLLTTWIPVARPRSLGYFLERRAPDVNEQQVQLLDMRCNRGRYRDNVVSRSIHQSGCSSQCNGDRAPRTCRTQAANHVLRAATRGKTDNDVSWRGQRFNLSLEQRCESEVVSDAGQAARVARQCQRGIRLPRLLVSPDKLGSQVTRLCCAAAIAERDNLVPAAHSGNQRKSRSHSGLGYRGERAGGRLLMGDEVLRENSRQLLGLIGHFLRVVGANLAPAGAA
jgi:hypothetical protein